MTMYDVCIVGAGMIGSAAARHASLIPGKSVCLIGPREPKNRSVSNVFGSHYDEGRLYRCTHADPLWAILGKRSIAKYQQLQTDSGVVFLEGNGCLAANDKILEEMSDMQAVDADLVSSVKVLDYATARSMFPYMTLSDQHSFMYESQNAGCINPRKLVTAEQIMAEKQGCTIIDDVVCDVTEVPQHMQVTCESGKTITAGKVLVATGAFTMFRNLLPRSLNPDIKLLTRTLIFAEVPKDKLDYFRGMPAVVSDIVPGVHLKDTGPILPGAYMYILPPIKYPDGSYYIKLGTGPPYDMVLETDQQVIQWYINEAPQHHKKGLLEIFSRTFPDFTPASISYDTCLISRTPNKRPYIDLVTSRLGVALGGNGYGAKSCDEIGRLSVQLLLNNKWDFPFPRESMSLIQKSVESRL